MEPEGSAQFSQKLHIGPYPQPDKHNPHLQTIFPNIQFNIIFHLHLGLSSDLFSSNFPTKILCALRVYPCVLHVTPMLSSLI
jgi:hypothetical protein